MSKMSRFAGLFGFSASAAATAAASTPRAEDGDDDERKRKEGESDEDYEARMKALDEDKDKQTAAAEDEDDADKEKDGGKDAAAAITAARLAGVAEGTKLERARWDAVLSAPEAVGRGAAACTLLADNDFDAATITKTLATLPKESGRASLASRIAAEPAVDLPKPSSAQPPADNSPAAFAAKAAAAADKFRPKAAKA